MKIAGVIAEYNPFHAGHAYHLSQTRARTGCDLHRRLHGRQLCPARRGGVPVEMGARARWRCGAARTPWLNCRRCLPSALPTRSPWAAWARLMDWAWTCSASEARTPAFPAASPSSGAMSRPSWPNGCAKTSRRGCPMRAHGARLRRNTWASIPAGSGHPTQFSARNTCAPSAFCNPAWTWKSFRRAGDYHDASLPDAPSADAPRDPSRADEPSGETIFAGNVRFASATAIRAALREGRRSEALACVPAEARAILAHAGAMHKPDDLLLARLRGMSGAEIAGLPDVAEGLERQRFFAAQPTRPRGKRCWMR